jgi:predicted ABC-type ATPase
MQKRMRVFAGPNGSGKTTIIQNVVKAINSSRLGVYVNSDDIEKTLAEQNELSFSDYEIQVEEESVKTFFRLSQFSPVMREESDLWKRIKVQNNIFSFEGKIDSYLAADVADFIRRYLVEAGISFTFETVMSHAGKLDFFGEARNNGYKVYRYYIATEDPDINISRVNLRVMNKGHAVSTDIIRKRYYRSLQNLKAAVMLSDRAYLFDNSGSIALLIAEVNGGHEVNIIDSESVPAWVDQYLIGE